eukprot:4475456-Pleurochrysis_carterae.AAC.1
MTSLDVHFHIASKPYESCPANACVMGGHHIYGLALGQCVMILAALSLMNILLLGVSSAGTLPACGFVHSKSLKTIPACL